MAFGSGALALLLVWLLHYLLFNGLCRAVAVLAVDDVMTPSLLQVHVISRHGDRSPMRAFPKMDPYLHLWNNTGFAQLTQRGLDQHLELGRYLRRRYTALKLLTMDMSYHHIYVRSTDTNRTILSAQAQLIGLFPPGSDRILHWPQIPIHTVPNKEDLLLKMDSDCARSNRIWLAFQTSQLYLRKERHYKGVRLKLQKLLGEKRINLWRAIKLSDIISVWHLHGLPRPFWLSESMAKDLLEINHLKYYWMFQWRAAQRLRGGPLIGAVIHNMESLVHQHSSHGTSEQSPRLVVYSTHDSTVTATLSALQVFNQAKKPLPASALLIELYARRIIASPASESLAGANNSFEYTVRLYYRNTSRETPVLLHLPGCSLDCPLHELRRVTRDVVPSNLKKECQDLDWEGEPLEPTEIANMQIQRVVLYGLFILLTIEIFVILLCAHYLRRCSQKLNTNCLISIKRCFCHASVFHW